MREGRKTYGNVEEHVGFVVHTFKTAGVVGEFVARVSARCIPQEDAGDLAGVVFRHLRIAISHQPIFPFSVIY